MKDSEAVDRVSRAVCFIYWMEHMKPTLVRNQDLGMPMISWIKAQLERRRRNRDQVRADAQALASSDPINAYYDAQRMAARCRHAGELDEFMHWSRVAAEVARIEPRAQMDFRKARAIDDREEVRQSQTDLKRHENETSVKKRRHNN